MRHRKETWIYLMIMIAVSELAILFVAVMGYLNYRTSALGLQEQVISQLEKAVVSDLETAIGFGKSFENYYGMEDVFASFTDQVNGTMPFVLDQKKNLLYCGEPSRTEVNGFLSGREFQLASEEAEEKEDIIVRKDHKRMVLTAIRQDQNIIGYFGCLYSERISDSGLREVRRDIVLLAVIIGFCESLALAVFVQLTESDRWKASHHRKSDRLLVKLTAVFITGFSIVLLSALSISRYRNDYMDKMKDSVRLSVRSLEDTIFRVSSQGVDLRETDDLQEYIEDRISSLKMLRAVRVSDRISEVSREGEESFLISYAIDADEEKGSCLYLEAEISEKAAEQEMKNLVLVLLSTMIILMIFVFELNNLVELLSAKVRKAEKRIFSERQIGIALRFTGFLCSTAEYMCIPYAAMLIRERGESLFGMSVGMTAALPLTAEGFTQMIAMLCLPKFVRKFNVRVILMLSVLLMAACNMTVFFRSEALIIILCRAGAGIAYAGFKQVSNYLITRGYETEEGRNENISQDNAGLLAGASCGAGLGAILSSNSGYAMTFVFSSIVFIGYLLSVLFLLPWKTLDGKTREAEKPVNLRMIFRMLLSGEMLVYILAIGIPLNIGVMLCVTLIPAICQANGISDVMLSYCYIANGIGGIYLGPSLVLAAKKYFGLPASISFAFALTAAGLFILHLPPIIMMVMITSMILGFLDGFGTPLSISQFMELRVVKTSVDESTALIFSVVMSYVLLTIAPVTAELLLLPEKGPVSPMMIGVILYALAAVLVLFIKGRAKPEDI